SNSKSWTRSPTSVLPPCTKISKTSANSSKPYAKCKAPCCQASCGINDYPIGSGASYTTLQGPFVWFAAATHTIAGVTTTTNPDDITWMRRALALARGVMNSTTPNPRVGCVIVRDGRIVGEGATQPPGGPHAEVCALRDAAARGESV